MLLMPYLIEMLPVVTKCIKVMSGTSEYIRYVYPVHQGRSASWGSGAGDERGSIFTTLSIITKVFLRSVIVGSTDKKYMPFRAGGRASVCPLVAIKYNKFRKSESKYLLYNLQFSLSNWRPEKGMPY